MERWRERRKEGEREREVGCLTSVTRLVCVTFTTDKPGTHSSNAQKFRTGAAALERLQLMTQEKKPKKHY